MILESKLTCPNCKETHQEIMLEHACQSFFRCPACKEQIKAKEEECCVFCSYGDMPCPQAQLIGSACCSRD